MEPSTPPEGIDAEQLRRVHESYTRCRVQGDFLERFYERLWSFDPSIRDRFSKSNLEMQFLMVREAINSLLRYAGGSEAAAQALDRLAQVHSRAKHDVPPHLYELFARALIEVVAETDPKIDDALLASWREIVTPGLRRIAAGY